MLMNPSHIKALKHIRRFSHIFTFEFIYGSGSTYKETKRFAFEFTQGAQNDVWIIG